MSNASCGGREESKSMRVTLRSAEIRSTWSQSRSINQRFWSSSTQWWSYWPHPHIGAGSTHCQVLADCNWCPVKSDDPTYCREITFTFQTAVFLSPCCRSCFFSVGYERKTTSDSLATWRFNRQVYLEFSYTKFQSTCIHTNLEKKMIIAARRSFYCDAFSSVAVSDYSTIVFAGSIAALWSNPVRLKRRKKYTNLACLHLINAIHEGNPLKIYQFLWKTARARVWNWLKSLRLAFSSKESQLNQCQGPQFNSESSAICASWQQDSCCLAWLKS